MRNWKTLPVQYYSVYALSGISEFNDFYDAIAYAQKLRDENPDAIVEVSALIDWEN